MRADGVIQGHVTLFVVVENPILFNVNSVANNSLTLKVLILIITADQRSIEKKVIATKERTRTHTIFKLFLFFFDNRWVCQALK